MIRARLSANPDGKLIYYENSHRSNWQLQAIRIPKTFLQRSNLTEEVELEAFDGYIVIGSTAKRPREGWEEAFRAAADREKMSRSTQRSLRDCETRGSQRQRREM